MQSGRTLLAGLIDYAGLFPPASLGMPAAIAAYDEYRRGPDREALGRFVAPAARLRELSGSARDVLRADTPDAPWRVTVIAGEKLGDSLAEAMQFNFRHASGAEGARAICDAIEAPVSAIAAVESATEVVPDSFHLFLEVPIHSDPEPLISAMSGTRAAAKMRTGGVTASAIPSAADVLRFMKTCRVHGVPFKATAGLHHAIRDEYPLTYERNAPSGEMLGFLNVFLAAAFLDGGASDKEVLEILDERDASSFAFDEDGVTWRGIALAADDLARARSRFALSYGSCSFLEPVCEAKALGLIR